LGSTCRATDASNIECRRYRTTAATPPQACKLHDYNRIAASKLKATCMTYLANTVLNEALAVFKNMLAQ
jgi:hypothetical protein